MNTAALCAQVLLAVVFAGSGVARSTMSRERLLATGQTGAASFPMPVVRFTAAMELLAAAGLTLPWATGIAQVLTPVGAVGLAVVMIGAAASHIRLGEPRNVAANAVLSDVHVRGDQPIRSALADAHAFASGEFAGRLPARARAGSSACRAEVRQGSR